MVSVANWDALIDVWSLYGHCLQHKDPDFIQQHLADNCVYGLKTKVVAAEISFCLVRNSVVWGETLTDLVFCPVWSISAGTFPTFQEYISSFCCSSAHFNNCCTLTERLHSKRRLMYFFIPLHSSLPALKLLTVSEQTAIETENSKDIQLFFFTRPVRPLFIECI